MLKAGDIAVVIGSESIPSQFLGHYGKVVGVFIGKAAVELIMRQGTIGSLTHTANWNDLKKVGVAI